MSQISQTMIYVVHEDPVVMHTLLDFLSDLGYSAAPVHSLAELTASIGTDRHQVDVVIARLDAAETSRIDVLREMHRRYPQICVVLILGAQGGFSAADAVSCGVYTYLREPIWLSELELSLKRLLDRERIGAGSR
jgi:DNA-binding NtrC family response regulator